MNHRNTGGTPELTGLGGASIQTIACCMLAADSRWLGVPEIPDFTVSGRGQNQPKLAVHSCCL